MQSTVWVSISVTWYSLSAVLWAMASPKVKAARVRASVERMLTFILT